MEMTIKKDKSIHTGHQITVHRVLARSYSFFFLFFIIGIILDIIFPFKIFSDVAFAQVGAIMLVLASLLIFWAQNTSRNLNVHNITKETFFGGPYSFTRSPTHWGLLFLMLGFGMMINSFFVMILTIIAFIVAKLFFLKQEEAILANKYGIPYMEYKKLVKI